jgi:hypothetical protein
LSCSLKNSLIIFTAFNYPFSISLDNFPQTFLKNGSYGIKPMCEGYEIPEKEVISTKKLEKEKQSNQEEKPLTVTTS